MFRFITVKSFSSTSPYQVYLDRISSLVKTACFVDGASLTKDQQALLQRAVDARGFCMKMQGECDPGDLTGTVWTQAVHDGQGQRWYAAVVAGGAQGRDYAFVSGEAMLMCEEVYDRIESDIEALQQLSSRLSGDEIFKVRKELEALRLKQRQRFQASGNLVRFRNSL